MTDEDLRSMIASNLTCRVEHQYASSATLNSMRWLLVYIFLFSFHVL